MTRAATDPAADVLASIIRGDANAIVPDASFDSEAEPTEPDLAAVLAEAARQEAWRRLNERLMGNWLARAGR